MAKPYSSDLRQRAIALVEAGQSRRAVARLLDLDKSTVILWVKEPDRTSAAGGTCRARHQSQLRRGMALPARGAAYLKKKACAPPSRTARTSRANANGGSATRAALIPRKCGQDRLRPGLTVGDGQAEERGGNVQGSRFQPRSHHPVRALVSSIQAEPARLGGDDGRTRLVGSARGGDCRCAVMALLDRADASFTIRHGFVVCLPRTPTRISCSVATIGPASIRCHKHASAPLTAPPETDRCREPNLPSSEGSYPLTKTPDQFDLG
jgi:transposase-like protein